MPLPAVELKRGEPERKNFRFYRLAVWPELFGGYVLAREWGQLDQPGRLWLDPSPRKRRPAGPGSPAGGEGAAWIPISGMIA